MTSSLFRRLLLMALILVIAALFAVDYTLTRYSAGELGATQIRERILATLLGAALLITQIGSGPASLKH